MVRVVCDIEADALENPQNIWVIVCKDIDTQEVKVFRDVRSRVFLDYAKTVDLWVGHNFLGYDWGVLNSYGACIDGLRVLDTLVLSKLFSYSIPGGHSLEAWGERLGYTKDTFSDFSQWSQELEDRCIRDVEITYRYYTSVLKYLNSKSWESSIAIEHCMAIILGNTKDNGFKFDLKKAQELYHTLVTQLDTLDKEIISAFPPRPTPGRTIQPKLTRHGTLHRGDFRWCGSDDLSQFNGGPFTTFTWNDFNPGSTRQIVDRLSDAGWKPVEKTKGGGSWKVNERNLETVPDTAPEAVRSLVRRFLLKKRVTTLEEWFAAVRGSEGQERIHGTINHIGTWTHRCSHMHPNMGNVPSIASKYSARELKELAYNLGVELRSLWTCDSDNVLVGCDAEGIQLRIFAHYINDDEFTRSLVAGNKEDSTDCHSVNARALGDGVTRDQAKTFIYAFLLGVGLAKTATILGCSVGEAEERRNGFVNRYPGLRYIREELIPRDIARGYFDGFDGRKVIIPKTEGNMMGYVLGGYLQNGEACIMKHANVLWRRELVSNDIPFKQVNFIHDEWQTETPKVFAERVGETQGDSIRKIGELFALRCPMAGSYRIGRNWYETH